MFREQKEELEQSNRWAEELNARSLARGARIAELQEELAREQENGAADGGRLQRQDRGPGAGCRGEDAVGARRRDRLTCRDRADGRAGERGGRAAQTEKELEERTAWALRLEEEANALTQQLAHGARLAVDKLGRKVGLGPVLPL